MFRLIAGLFGALLLTTAAQAQNGLNGTPCTLSAVLTCLRAPIWAAPPALTGSVDYLTQTSGGGLRTQPQDGAGHDVSSAWPLAIAPGSVTLVTLDVATVTTGGTAVTALTAGHRTRGGWLQNPPSATVNLCIAEIGTASGTTSAGNTTCVVPGQTYVLTASANAVSVIAADSAHPFSGMGYQ